VHAILLRPERAHQDLDELTVTVRPDEPNRGVDACVAVPAQRDQVRRLVRDA
jgi:hypothetical protein